MVALGFCLVKSTRLTPIKDHQGIGPWLRRWSCQRPMKKSPETRDRVVGFNWKENCKFSRKQTWDWPATGNVWKCGVKRFTGHASVGAVSWNTPLAISHQSIDVVTNACSIKVREIPLPGLTNEVHLDSVGLLRIKEYTKSKKCKAIKAKHVAS